MFCLALLLSHFMFVSHLFYRISEELDSRLNMFKYLSLDAAQLDRFGAEEYDGRRPRLFFNFIRDVHDDDDCS